MKRYQKIDLKLKDAHIWYLPNFYSNKKVDAIMQTLIKTIKWQQDDIAVFGKTYKQPRLTALYGHTEKTYSYSNITMTPNPFTALLLEIKQDVEQITQNTFNACLLNLYRNGKDSNGWHSDNEKELGIKPVIASLSFGAERLFHFKHKYNKELKQNIILQHGSLLVMQGSTQKYWLHQLPKTKIKIKPRINLTFRYIK